MIENVIIYTSSIIIIITIIIIVITIYIYILYIYILYSILGIESVMRTFLRGDSQDVVALNSVLAGAAWATALSLLCRVGVGSPK